MRSWEKIVKFDGKVMQRSEDGLSRKDIRLFRTKTSKFRVILEWYYKLLTYQQLIVHQILWFLILLLNWW
jgi:hypothetical protein